MIEIPKSFWLDKHNTPFPDIGLALKNPNGLIGIGGDLSTKRLLKAYSQGIFPWYSEEEPILWYSPDPRMVITPEVFHLSKSLNKIVLSKKFEVRMNTAFVDVITHCQTIFKVSI